MGAVDEVFSRPAHPYTRALLAAMPSIDADSAELEAIPGQPPSPADLPSGCPFHPRCVRAEARCSAEVPAPLALGRGRLSLCHFRPENQGLAGHV
jgi:oligopeptide/dipeptide ABC transporter ATP-binding protein